LDRHVGDARRARAAPRPREQGLHRIGRTLDLHLDGAVGPVAHPTGDAEPAGLLLGRAAEPDALHAAAYDEMRADVRRLCHRASGSRSFRNASSSRILVPSFFALVSFDPGSAPATT